MTPDLCFVDTSSWLELFTPNSKYGKVFWALILSEKYRFYTSDFVLDELLTNLRRNRLGKQAEEAWELLTNNSYVKLLHLTPDDINEVYANFKKFSDKDWSFTDCSSYMLMKRHRIHFAASTDKHFREFGIATIIP